MDKYKSKLNVFMHFPVFLLFTLILFGAVLGYLIFSLGTYSESDIQAYQKLIHGDQTKPQELSLTTKQQRIGVQKTAFFTEDGQRLQFKLCSKNADLILEMHDGHFEAIEQMHGMECYLQESLLDGIEEFGPAQKVLFLKADAATYNYTNETFLAENVFAARYLAEGHAIETPLNSLQPSILEIRASNVAFDGKEMTLKGNAYIKNNLGNISAENVLLSFLKDTKKRQFDFLQNVNEITADQNIFLDYTGKFFVTADHAIFQRNNQISNTEESLALPGRITLFSDLHEGQLCNVYNRNGSNIYAETIRIDTIKRELAFTHPRGTLANIAKNDEGKSIEFSADFLIWDEQTERLVMQKNVKINQPGIGLLQNQEEVSILLNTIDGKKNLHTIDAAGSSTLTHNREGFSHILKCFGLIKVDHQKMEAKLYSPKNADGFIFEDKQVVFEDPKGEIFANNALIQYSEVEGEIVPSKIVLAGNVKISNRLVSPNDATKTVLQYILADRVEFFPRSKEMILKGTAGRRVLFFDKVNTLQLSAPQLKIIRDKATKKETVQGIGDVRFSFIEPEFEQLRKRFSLDMPDSTKTNVNTLTKEPTKVK